MEKQLSFSNEELLMINNSLEQSIRAYHDDIRATVADAELENGNKQMAVDWYKERIIEADKLISKIILKVPVWG